MILELVQKFVPLKVKTFLKPYFRLIFPNKLMSVLWITFRCTYSCSYCPFCSKQSNFPQQFPIECEKSGEEWIEALKKIPPTSFYISGGEPFLYKDLPYIINNLPDKHSIIGIITNLSMPISVYEKVSKKIHLNVSFHREFVNETDFIEKILALKNRFHINVNIVATEENFDFIKNKIHIFDKNEIPYHIDPLVDNANKIHEYSIEYKELLKKYLEKSRTIKTEEKLAQKIPKKCSAGRNYYNLLPNGNALVCSRIIDYKYSPFIQEEVDESACLGNIFDGSFYLNSDDCICKYDCIAHCDRDYAKISIIKNKVHK